MRTLRVSCAGIVAILGGASAHAQTVAAAPLTSPGATQTTGSSIQEQGGLQEIVVTAERRAESSQKVAVPINVVSGDQIVASGISSVDQLTELVPALDAVSQGSYNYFFIRGAGNFASTSYSDPAVAFNYAGVYVGRPTSVAGVFYDLDRVEVLKGPQGTLYGRNATGGVVNVIPMEPQLDQFSGNGSVSYGNYSAVNVQGALNLPLGSNTAIRLSANDVSHDGYLNDGESSQRTQAVRAQIKSVPTSELTIRVAADYAHDGGNGAGYSYANRYTYDPALTGLPLGQQFTVVPSNLNLAQGAFSPDEQAFRETAGAGPAKRNLTPLDTFPHQDNDFVGVNAQIDYATDLGTLTLIPGYRHAHLNNLSGQGFPVYENEGDSQSSVEARFGKQGLSIFDYTVGVYYFDEAIDSLDAVAQGPLANFQTFTTGTTSYAGFGQLTAHLTDQLRLVGGVRYTKDRKRFDGASTDLLIICVAPACPTTPLFPTYQNLNQLPFPIPPTGVPVGRGPGPGTIMTRADIPVDDHVGFDKTTYRGAIEYDLAPSSLVYGSIETGFRSGGFNLAQGYETYQPETITAYTLGSKNRFVDNRVQANLELFYWKYDNQQEPHVGIDLGGNQGFFTQNIGSSTIKGAEFDGKLQATPSTILAADIQYLDAVETNFFYQSPVRSGVPYTSCAVTPSSNPALFNVSCSGKPNINSPKLTTNLSALQLFPLGNGYRVGVEVDTQYRSSHFIGFDYSSQEFAGGVWRSNAYVNFGKEDDRWNINLFVRNIEGYRTPTFGVNAAIFGLGVVIPSDPRVFGVRLSAKF